MMSIDYFLKGGFSMEHLKIVLQKKSRKIVITYTIKNRKKDKEYSIYILNIALKNKLVYTTYEDDFCKRCFILKGVHIKQIEEAYKQIEKLK